MKQIRGFRTNIKEDQSVFISRETLDDVGYSRANPAVMEELVDSPNSTCDSVLNETPDDETLIAGTKNDWTFKLRTERIRYFENALKSGRFLEFAGHRAANFVQSIRQFRLKIHVDPRGTSLYGQLRRRRNIETVDLAGIMREIKQKTGRFLDFECCK